MSNGGKNKSININNEEPCRSCFVRHKNHKTVPGARHFLAEID